MKKIILLISLMLLSFAIHAESIFISGLNPNQLIVKGSKAYVIDSGVFDREGKKQTVSARVTTIDLKNKKRKQSTKFLKGNNIYRGVIHQGLLYVTVSNKSEIYELSTSFDLLFNKYDITQPAYKSKEHYGLESIVAAGNKFWVAYNSLEGDNQYGTGVLEVLQKSVGQLKKKQKVILPAKNPKYMVASAKWIAVSTGVYGKDDGKVILIHHKKVPKKSVLRLHRQGGSYYHVVETGGTPGSLFFDESSQKLYACDIENDSGRFFVIDPKTGKSLSVKGEFNDCGAILAHKGKIYVANFSARVTSRKKNESLFVYNQNSHQEVCRKKVDPSRSKTSRYPNSLGIYSEGERDQLLMTFSLNSSPARLAVLPLKSSGKPKNCF